MIHLYNQTDEEVSARFEGRAYIFPPKAIVDIDSKDLAREFCAKTYHPPDQRSGRPQGMNDLIEVTTIPSGIPIAKTLRFLPPPPPESLPNLDQTEPIPLDVASTEPPRPASRPIPLDVASTEPPRPATQPIPLAGEIKQIVALGRNALVDRARKHGVLKLGDTTTVIAEKLHAVGFRA